MIFYPYNGVSTILGSQLLDSGHNIFFYIPSDLHMDMAYTVPHDLKVKVLGSDRIVDVCDSLENTQDMDFIIYPSLDVLPEKSRKAFAYMCNRTFRYIM